VVKRIAEFVQNALIGDCYVVAYSYSPLLNDEFKRCSSDSTLNPLRIEYHPEQEISEESLDALLQKNQTFLGLACFKTSPKPVMREWIVHCVNANLMDRMWSISLKILDWLVSVMCTFHLMVSEKARVIRSPSSLPLSITHHPCYSLC
jgi:hypothetical protein